MADERADSGQEFNEHLERWRAHWGELDEDGKKDMAESVRREFPLAGGDRVNEPLADVTPVIGWLARGVIGGVKLLIRATKGATKLSPDWVQTLQQLAEELYEVTEKWTPGRQK